MSAFQITQPDMDHSKQDLFVQLHIVDVCNLKCRHCYVGGKLFSPRTPPSINTVKAWIDNVSHFYKQMGFKSTTVALTGGEPLLRSDIVDLIAYMTFKELTPFIITNGLLFTDSLAKQLRKNGLQYINFSLEGLEKQNDLIRGDGTFKKVLHAIDIARSNNILITVGVTVSKSNFGCIEEFVKFVDPLVSMVHIREIFHLGNAVDMETLTDGQRYKLFKFVRDYKGKSTLVCEDPCICTIKDGPIREYGCSSMRHHFCVDVNGNIYPCRLIEIPIGTISNIQEAWFSEMGKKIRHRIGLKGACEKCELLQHCGGCRAYALSRGDLFGEDDRCFLLRPILKGFLNRILDRFKL